MTFMPAECALGMGTHAACASRVVARQYHCGHAGFGIWQRRHRQGTEVAGPR